MNMIQRKGFGGVLGALVLAAELAVLADWLAVGLRGEALPRVPWLLGAGVLFLLLALLPVRRHKLPDAARHVLMLFLIVLLGSQGILLYLRRSGGYTVLDQGKSALYAGHRVLVTVPEPGEETVLAGGVIEQYLRYGSDVSFFYTGDATEDAARAAAVSYGLPAENARVRNAAAAGEALGAFLAERQPDVVLAAAPETGVEVPDLEALLDELRTEAPGYEPLVLRGFLRTLGTEAPADFYAANILSTQKPARSLKGFNWEKRVRLPVDAATLSRSLPVSGTGASVLTADAAERAVNGDKVFWPLKPAAGENEPAFVKIQNGQEDFVYDYYIDPLGRESFTLYTVGDADQPYSVSVQGDKCSARIGQERTLTISCPKNQRCIVTVTSGDGKYWDTVMISNPGRFYRVTGQRLEQEFRHFWEEIVPPSNSFQLATQGWEWARARLRSE